MRLLLPVGDAEAALAHFHDGAHLTRCQQDRVLVNGWGLIAAPRLNGEALRDHDVSPNANHIAHACILLLLLTSCKSSFSEEKAATLSSQLQKDATSQTAETRTVTQGPETITTRVRKYGPPEEVMSTEPEPERLRSPSADHQHGLSVGRGASSDARRGPLLEETIIVDHRDPVVSQATLQASGATETTAEAKADSTDDLKKARAPAGLLGSLLGLWPLFLIAALALAGFVGWKLLKARLP